MIPFFEALAIVRAAGAARPLPAESVPIERAVGRVAAAAVDAREPNPPFDNAGMDGFAIRAADLAAASAARPVTLPVGATLLAGDDAAGVAAAGAVEIMTGAPIPAGLDAVVRVEDVEVARDAAGRGLAATFRAPAAPGENVRPRGDDFARGERLVAPGTLLGPEHVLALATVGEAAVAVRRRPRIALVSTGKELAHHTVRDLPPGGIRNSTTPFLAAAVPLHGAELVLARSAGDDVAAFREAVGRAAADGVDLVVTTGAVSAGKHDYVPAALAALGARTAFHKVATRPGKPILFAELPGGPVVLGFPGNPVASAVGLRFLASAFLRAALGLPPEEPLRALLRADVRKPEGLRWFVKARLEVGPRGATVEVLRGQGSAIVGSMLAADCWAVLPEPGDRCAAGTEVDVFPLNPRGR